AGPPGPCGPNSEMFYWAPLDEAPPGEGYMVEGWLRDEASGKWVEIWNDVFIQYEWQGAPKANGKGYDKIGMPELPFRSIDTGMGIERTAFVLAGQQNAYDTEGFQAIFRAIRPLAAQPSERAERIVADHLRTATFCLGDGIRPGNTGRGYVLRRLIRRAILQGQRGLGITDPFLPRVARAVIDEYGDIYPELSEQAGAILDALAREEELFRRTLEA
ncbi:MAG: alanine--tRNA ligase, partial [Armatimonadota bacterium]